MEELRYKEVETALIDVLGVKPAKLGSFRGKLQNLRRLGLPALKPGSGAQIQYTRRQALELLLALLLEDLGHKPREVVKLAGDIVHGMRWGVEGHDYYAMIRPKAKAVIQAMTPEALQEMIGKRDPAVALINVSACIEKLYAALDKALTAA
jgi:hypothetical protein